MFYDVPFKFNGELKKLSVDLKAPNLGSADEKKVEDSKKTVALIRE